MIFRSVYYKTEAFSYSVSDFEVCKLKLNITKQKADYYWVEIEMYLKGGNKKLLTVDHMFDLFPAINEYNLKKQLSRNIVIKIANMLVSCGHSYRSLAFLLDEPDKYLDYDKTIVISVEYEV